MRNTFAYRFLVEALSARAWRIGVGCCVLAALGAYWNVPQRIANVGEVRLPMCLLALLSSLGVMATRAWRWNLLLDRVGRILPVRSLLAIYGATFFIGTVLPGPVAEILRAWLIRDRVEVQSFAVATLIYDRLFDIIPLFVVSAIFGATLGMGQISHTAFVLLVAIVIGMVILCAMILRPRFLFFLTQSVVARMASRFAEPGTKPSSAESVPAPRISPSTWWAAAGLSLASQIFLILQTYFIALAILSKIDPWTAYAVTGVATLIAAIPGGLGTREAAICFILSRLGVSTHQAFDFSLLCFVNFLLVLTLSFFAFISQPLHAAHAWHLLRARGARYGYAAKQPLQVPAQTGEQ